MKRVIIIILILLPALITNGQSAVSKLESMESAVSQQQKDYYEAYTTSSTRLFSEKYDLTTVIMLIPKDSLIYLFSSDDDYIFVEYNGIQGYIFNQDVRLAEGETVEAIQPEPEPLPQVAEEPRETIAAEPPRTLSVLQARYGNNIGIKVYSGKIWRGMTADMVYDSWGDPIRINEVKKRGITMQEWIYNNTWLYLENGILLEWGPTRRR